MFQFTVISGTVYGTSFTKWRLKIELPSTKIYSSHMVHGAGHFIPTELGDFVRGHVGIHIPGPSGARSIWGCGIFSGSWKKTHLGMVFRCGFPRIYVNLQEANLQ